MQASGCSQCSHGNKICESKSTRKENVDKAAAHHGKGKQNIGVFPENLFPAREKESTR